MSGEFTLSSNHFVTAVTLYYSTLVGHEGNVWAVQQKNEVLITGSHDNTVCKLVTPLHLSEADL